MTDDFSYRLSQYVNFSTKMLSALALMSWSKERPNGDAVEPRVDLRLAPEVGHAPEGLDEDLLRQVLGVVMVAGEVVGESEQGTLVLFHQLVKRSGRAALSRFGHQGRS